MPAADPPRGRYPVAGSGPCRDCGFLTGTNLGKCLNCFMAYGDMKLSHHLDLMADQHPLYFAHRAAVVLQEHGPFLKP